MTIEEEKTTEPLVADADSGFDAAEVFGGPAVLVNKTYITNTAFGLRITFTEVWGPEANEERSRAAVFLSYEDAIQFHDIFTSQLQRIALPEDATEKKIQ